MKRIVIAALIALSVILPGLSFTSGPSFDIPSASAACSYADTSYVYNGGSYLSGGAEVFGCSGWNQFTVCIGYAYGGGLIRCNTVYGTYVRMNASVSCTRNWGTYGPYAYAIYYRINSGQYIYNYSRVSYFTGSCY